MPETIAKLVIKKTSSPGATPAPSFLDYGELALNYTDGKLFFKNNLGSIISIGEVDDTDYAKKSETNIFIGLNRFDNSTEFTAPSNFGAGVSLDVLTLSSGLIAWDGEDGNLATVTLTSNSTLDYITNVAPGSYVLRVIQDGVGGRSLDFGPNFKSATGTPPVIATNPNSITIITILNTGGSDLYLVSQSDFLDFSGVLPEPPEVLGVVGIAIGDWMGDTNYYRIPDMNGFPAWRYVETDLRSGLISANVSGVYKIEVFERLDSEDPWTLTQEVFEANAPGDPTSVPGWTATGTYLPDPIVVVSAIISPPLYNGLVTVALGGIGVGSTTQFFEQPGIWTWYGVDPIPEGSIYRCINPFNFPAFSHLYMAPRDNDVNGEWGIAFRTSGNSLLEFIRILPTAGTPAGTYESVPGPTDDYTMVVTPVLS